MEDILNDLSSNSEIKNFLSVLPATYAKKLSPEKIVEVRKYLHKRLHSDLAVPMVCLGKNCQFASQCPLSDNAPVGELCPFEVAAAEKWRQDYIKSLSIRTDDKIEMILLNELVEIDILMARANMIIAQEGFVMENIIGINEQTGEPMYRKEEHVALGVKRMLTQERSKILKAMVATRESKVKLMKDFSKDPSEYLSKLRERARQLAEGDQIDVIYQEQKQNNS